MANISLEFAFLGMHANFRGYGEQISLPHPVNIHIPCLNYDNTGLTTMPIMGAVLAKNVCEMIFSRTFLKKMDFSA